MGVSDKETEEDSETTHGDGNSIVKKRIVSVLSVADQLDFLSNSKQALTFQSTMTYTHEEK